MSFSAELPYSTVQAPETQPTGDDVDTEVIGKEALQQLLPALQALKPEELLQVNLDIPGAVVTVLGSLPEIRAQREELVKQLPTYDHALYDALETYAAAVNEAHGDYLIATQPQDDLSKLVEEASTLRDQLQAEAVALSKRGLVDGNRLKELAGSTGYKNLALDLMVLTKTLQASWSQVAGKSATTEAELARAGKLQLRLMRVVGLREEGTAAVAAATELRTRAFTGFMKAYDHVRRAVTFLRWNEGDAERVAPSLYTGRGSGKKKVAQSSPTLTGAQPWSSPVNDVQRSPNGRSAELARFHERTSVRVLTPGASSGEALHVLSPLERRSSRWDSDPESARAALSAAVSLVLRLLGRDPDPAKSREHVFLSVLAERRLLAGEHADLAALMQDVATPPVAEIGALPVNSFLRKSERSALAAGLNTLLASPTFASWRQGATLDVGDWLTPRNGRTPAVILSVAHLDDEERALVLGVLLEEVLSWVRGLSGSQRLKALLIFDEVYGFLPPHPANPPTKRPLVALMKQARAFGVGVVVATQNPMDLDYRALSNAGLWCIGRLQTDADRARVLDGLSGAQNVDALTAAELGRTVQRLANRWFVVRNAHASSGPILMQPRYAMSWLRGPMTRAELKRAREGRTTIASTQT